MRIPWDLVFSALLLISLGGNPRICRAQDDGGGADGGGDAGADGGGEDGQITPPKEMEGCNGIFLQYNFDSREKEYPHVKNATAQSWAFKSQLLVINGGDTELQSWKAYIGFHHDEIIVSTEGGTLFGGDSFPFKVGENGTYVIGTSQSDLKTAIDTAGDMTQMGAKVKFKGTMFGVQLGGNVMPKTIKLDNDGFKCPAPKKGKNSMQVCCRKDPKYKVKKKTEKFFPLQNGDFTIMYDVIQAYQSNYLTQVTMDNNHPLGRLSNWNLSFEFMHNEFIYDMRGAYTRKKDISTCLNSPAGQYYKDMDFSKVMNCDKKPIISDLPLSMKNDKKMGRLPFCCRNGSILPKTMNASESRSVFQMNVFKLAPDLNRTAIRPPQNWKIEGVVNPNYKCGQPVRVDPTDFPDPMGLDAKVSALASYQIVCNITKPKPRQHKCCVSFSAFYADAAVPCRTCACGCENEDTQKCNPKARALPVPPDALLVPFANRTKKARVWAKLKHLHLPKRLPCPDNCGVSLNWHLNSDFKTGYTARLTIFNWDSHPFEDWFTAVMMKKPGGFENVYSFNGTKLPNSNRTIFLQAMPGLSYIVPIANGTKPDEPMVPGKQQTVISFLKKHTPHIDVTGGDGFPSKVIFNGQECSLPKVLPKNPNASFRTSSLGLVPAVLVALLTFFLISSH